MFSGSWNSFDMSMDESFKEDVMSHFQGGKEDQLLNKLKGQLTFLSEHDRVYLWVWAIAKQHDRWIWALWNHPSSQADVILTSVLVLMSGDWQTAMPGQKDRQVIAYETLICLLKTRGEKIVEEFDREVLGLAVQKSMLTTHDEDHRLLEMFSRRSNFSQLRVGYAGQSDIVDHLLVIVDPIVQAQEIDHSTGKVIAASMAKTMQLCCQAGIDLTGNNGMKLGQALARGCQVGLEVFKPLMDDWITYGGHWKLLLDGFPDLQAQLASHPRIRAARLMDMYGREDQDQEPPEM